MSSLSITRRFEFDAAHRVLNHESKCRFLHGHRYVAEIRFSHSQDRLDKIGRIIDFGRLKEIIGGWINEYWDHNILLNQEDPLIKLYSPESEIFAGAIPYIFPANPTAEVMAKRLAIIAARLLEESDFWTIQVEEVRIYETPNCWADYHPIS